MLFSCNAVKRLDKGEYLLTENTIYVDSSKIGTNQVYLQLYQQTNTSLPLIDFPLRLHIYNTAKPNPDSLFYHWLYKKPKREQHWISFLSKKQVERLGNKYIDWQEFKKNVGEAPVIVDKKKTAKSADRLRAWYWNRGWFNVESRFDIDTIAPKRAKVAYYVDLHQPYIIDSLTSRIASPVVDSLYQKFKKRAFLREGRQFDSKHFDWERQRLTSLFRNHGLYYFDQANIMFNVDTINTNHKALVKTVISNREVSEVDTTYTVPFKIRHISGVNVFTDILNKDLQSITDSVQYKNFTIYSSGKLQYRPKALADAVFIKQGDFYKDRSLSLTYDRMTDLGIFQYPDIEFIEDPRDSTHTDLIANVFLQPRKKYGVTFNFDVSRSNIQDLGLELGASLLIRNVFHGLETLEIGARASIGSSTDASVSTYDRFFNISEIGATVKLNFPKIIFPINVEGIIPKTMSPFTTLSAGISTQHNIGLDKQSLTAKYVFRWKPNREESFHFNLIDLEYVRNLNPGNYFSVYQNSYHRLNNIAQNHVAKINPAYFDQTNPVLSTSPTLNIPNGANAFINDIKHGSDFGMSLQEWNEAHTLIERKDRLTENNLIFGSSIHYVRNTRQNIYDQEFTQFRINFEAVGNSLALLSRAFEGDKNDDGSYNISGVRFSQYLKIESDLIKHWDLGGGSVLAMKALAGIAIPYGNSENIPFVRSFFAGGANDNRGWRPYDLGPGSSGGPNEFNEANMKLSFNIEYRFNLFGNLYSAVFVDMGNIWNVLDNVKNERARFSSFSDLGELAVSSGFGFRYDFDFFVIRLDLGFKTYDPAYNKQQWFEDYNFGHSVLNIGINYPF